MEESSSRTNAMAGRLEVIRVRPRLGCSTLSLTTRTRVVGCRDVGVEPQPGTWDAWNWERRRTGVPKRLGEVTHTPNRQSLHIVLRDELGASDFEASDASLSAVALVVGEGGISSMTEP
ncbi:unnamed protein product [Tuber aestivum]|uniref:Uncharacterized protein n=1 Tax=Tuber aestivum TaxID=59557 RepID=A0A292PWQ0_9PEZI|nr:unnamed protein product [Tuber aestivum]